jgi:hypothetical protein
MIAVSRLVGISSAVLLAPWVAIAQENSFATTIQNNAMWGANLTKQMINLGGSPTSGGARAFNPANCMPPADLQRGADGHVPPELQGDPRYQEYLRCKQGIPPNSTGAPGAASAPAASRTTHLPITATDFVPARPGHPTIDQAISNMSITPEQRQQLHDRVDERFRGVAAQYRGNNVAVAVAVAYATSMSTLNAWRMNQQQNLEFIYDINDQLAQSPRFALMTAQERQDESDQLIFESVIISTLRDEGAHNPQAQEQAQELSRVTLRQFGSSAAAATPPPHKVTLGVKVGPVTPALAAAAGFQGSEGAFVVEVTPGSAAGRAGIKAGDILTRVNDRDIKTAPDVPNAIASMNPGEVIAVLVFRQGAKSDLTVVF